MSQGGGASGNAPGNPPGLGFKKASAAYSRSNDAKPSAGPSPAPPANEFAAAPAIKAGTSKEKAPVKRTSKQQPGSDIRNFFGGKGGGGASSANGPSVCEASGSGSDTVSSSAKGSSAHKEGSGKAKAIIFSKEGAKASGASSSSPSPLGPQVGSSYQLESVVVGRQFHAPLPTDLSGIALSVEREPHNAVDPLALLVKTSSEPVGHLPARVAKVLSPLLDVDIISLGVSPLDPAAPPPLSAASPWPVRLHIMFLSDGSNHPETPSLMTLVGQQLKRKDKERAQETSKRQRLKFSQRSLLHNFGAKQQAATALVSGDARSATLLTDMPDPVLQHIFLGGGLPTAEVLTSVRATCRRWKTTVDTLHEQSLVWRVQVLRICAHQRPSEDLHSVFRPLPPSPPLPGSLPLLLSYVTERYPPLPRHPVHELCVHLGPPKWVEGLDIICSAFGASGEGSGWALLTMALLTAPNSTTRHAIAQHMLPPPGRQRLVEAPDFLAFLAMLIVLVATNWDEVEDGTAEGDAAPQDPSDGSWSWLPGARWTGAWRGLREDLFVAYQRLETRAIDLSPKGLAKGGRALTAEQQDIVMSHDSRATDPCRASLNGEGKEGEPSLMVVTAFAGTGKTTTLRAYAEARPDRKFLYLCFNVSVREEAQKTFPKNVQAKNIHQLAFGAVGYRYAKKLTADLKVTELADYLRLSLPSSSKGKGQGSGLSNLVLAARVIASLNAFFASPDPAPATTHIAPAKPTANSEPLPVAQVLSLVEQAWRVMKDSNDTALPMTHSGYVKLYQLSRPDLSRAYDVIMLDEAQDVSPAIGDVILRQKAPRVLCGDSHQAIYSFIGAQDYVRQAGGAASRRKHLSECFRFGTAIAEIANALLSTLKGETRRLIGLGGGRVVGSDAVLEEPWTLIARTNATLIAFCIHLLSQEKRVAFVGGLEGYNLDALADVCHLADRNKEAIVSNFVRRFQSITTLTAYVTATDDAEWQSRLRLVQSHGSARLLELIAHLKQHHDAQAPTAHVLLSTVHKAKGLEFDRVALADDLVRLVRDEEDMIMMADDGHFFNPQQARPDPEEVNMLYVAVTRAKKELRLNADLQAWLRQQGCCDRFTVSAVGPEEPPEPCDLCSRPALGSVVPIPDPPTAEQQAQQAAAPRHARDGAKGPLVLVKRESGRHLCHPCLAQQLPEVAALFLGRKVPSIPVVRAAPEAQVVMIDSDDEEEEQEEEEED